MGVMDIIFRAIFGSRSENQIKKIMPIVNAINEYEETMAALPDEALRGKTEELKAKLERHIGATPSALDLTAEEDKKRLQEGLDAILPEAFAVAREASKRTTGMRHFDVQLIGGAVLHSGKIAEMKTGEGKTLVATLPVYLNALTGLGVHVVTVNDYLAKRDAEWMSPIYKFLGLSVGILDQTRPHSPERRAAYAADIIYGTNNEFGFDYLRDNMAPRWADKVQREFYYAIVDEVDSVLIDEARTPLIISGQAERNIELYYKVDKIIPRLKEAETDERKKEIAGTGDYVLDEKDKNVYLTEEGVSRVEQLLDIQNLYGGSVDVIHHVNQALKAHKCFKRDIDYVVQDGQVFIVDEFTGRILDGRRYSDGLHQAIEAKERVAIQNESQTYATITFQNYFRMYAKLAGMTGTAETEAEEFVKIYNLDVTVIPTNKPLARIDMSDKVFRTKRGKYGALAKYIRELQDARKPALIGTASVEANEELAKFLKREGVRFEALNAKNHAREAEIIANAGEPGAVTLATNMAGRGTDIVLGGNPTAKGLTEIERIVTVLKDRAFKERDPYKKEELQTKAANIDRFKEAFVRAVIAGNVDEAKTITKTHDIQDLDEKIGVIAEIRERSERNKAFVIENGGLHVIGSERHEARRIDNQLRGRSGRQGDPGLSVFFLSLEDDLMRLFGSERIAKMMLAMGFGEEEELEHKLLNRSIENAQRKVEGRNFDIRKHLLEYDDVMNQQRTAIYDERNNTLKSTSVEPRVLEIIDEVADARLSEYCPSGKKNEWDREGLVHWLEGYMLRVDDKTLDELFKLDGEDLATRVRAMLRSYYGVKKNEVDEALFHRVERDIFLQIIDTKWKDHLYAMDALREGIGLRGYAEKNPLTEYKLEGYKMFSLMIDAIREDLASLIFRVRINPNALRAMQEEESGFMGEGVEQKEAVGAFSGFGKEPRGEEGAHPHKARNQVIAGNKVGRNEPCPCGSGMKYKHCHGKDEA